MNIYLPPVSKYPHKTKKSIQKVLMAFLSMALIKDRVINRPLKIKRENNAPVEEKTFYIFPTVPPSTKDIHRTHTSSYNK